MSGVVSGEYEALATAPENADYAYQRAWQELACGNTLGALARLEGALRQQDRPAWHSFLGYCIAKERGHLTKGLELCRACLEREPGDPLHYYFLAKVLLLSGRKPEAIETLRQGMAYGGHPAVLELFEQLGVRKRPVMPWLGRDNPFNKYLGIVLARIGLR